MEKVTVSLVNLAAQSDPSQKFSVAGLITPGDQALLFNTENELTLTFSNTADSPIILKGGKAVAEGSLPPNGPAAFYVMFGGRLTSDQMSKIEMKATGWNPGVFFDGGFPAIALVPAQDIPIPAQGSVQLTLTNIVVSGTAGNSTLTVDYYDIPGIAAGAPQWSLPVQNPPSGGKDLDLTPSIVSDAGLDPGIMLISDDPLHPLPNVLKVRLQNDTPDPVPIADTVAFTIWFLYANPPGYVALTSADHAKQINLTATRVGQTRDAWPSQINDDDSGRTWTLQPKDLKAPGSQLLEGHGGTLELVFDNIITVLAAGGTAAYIQWTGIPGYNDGYCAIDFQKLPAARIDSFAVSPWHLDPIGDAVTATFAWNVANAVALEIVGVQDVTGLTSLAVPGSLPRDYVLQARNPDRSVRLPDAHALIVSFLDFLCGKTFVLNDFSHTVDQDIDGSWTTDQTLVETLALFLDGTGHWAYTQDGSTYRGRFDGTPFHYADSSPVTWTRAGGQISVSTSKGPIVLQAVGDTLVCSTAIEIGFPRRNMTFV